MSCLQITLFRLQGQCRCISLFRYTQHKKYFNTNVTTLQNKVALWKQSRASIERFVHTTSVRRLWDKLGYHSLLRVGKYFLPDLPRHYRQRIKKFLIGGGFVSCCLLSVYLFYNSHLERNPVTGQYRFMLDREDQLNKSYQWDKERLSRLEADIIYTNEDNNGSFHGIFRSIIEANQTTYPFISEKNWKMTVYHDDSPQNTFTSLSGHIFLSTGILQMARNEHQLAFVISHEFAHAIMEHAIEELSSKVVVDRLFTMGIAFFGMMIPSNNLLYELWMPTLITGYVKFEEELVNLPRSRRMEYEADKVGLELMARACYDVREARKMYQRLHEKQLLSNENEWDSTHPTHKHRADYLDSLMTEAIKLREQSNCGPLPAEEVPDGFQAMMANHFKHVQGPMP